MIVGASIRESIINYIEKMKCEAQELDIREIDDVMSYYDTRDAYFLLYEFRFLDDDQRYICASYIAKNKLGANVK